MIEIAVNLIFRGPRIRQINERRVTKLMASIGDVGLLNPITVARYPSRTSETGEEWLLLAGLHRLEAKMRLGHPTIAAIVKDLTGPASMIAQCDENLCGSNLSIAERALFTKYRKAAYLELYPETRAHAAGAHAANRSMGNASAKLAPAFTADAAAKTGQRERTVQRDALRGEKIPVEILEKIVGTPLDSGVVLDRLAKAESPERELAIVERDRESGKARQREASANRRPARRAPISSVDAQRIAPTTEETRPAMSESAGSSLDRQQGRLANHGLGCKISKQKISEAEENNRQLYLFNPPTQLDLKSKHSPEKVLSPANQTQTQRRQTGAIVEPTPLEELADLLDEQIEPLRRDLILGRMADCRLRRVILALARGPMLRATLEPSVPVNRPPL